MLMPYTHNQGNVGPIMVCLSHENAILLDKGRIPVCIMNLTTLDTVRVKLNTIELVFVAFPLSTYH